MAGSVSLAPAGRSATLAGVGLMAAAMLTIPMVDGIAKYLSAAHSPLYLSWARYMVASLAVLPLALARHGRSFLPREQLGAHLLRTAFLVASMTCFFLAIARIPLATALSATFVSPIIAMVLAVLLLGERLTPRRIGSLVIGFAGALVILRPTASTDPGLLLALAAGTLFACYLIATRRASPRSDPVKTLTFQCLLGSALLTPQAIAAWSVPSAGELWLFLAMGLLSATSHMLSITAFRYAPASILAPLVYLELLGAVAIGLLVFREMPDTFMWAGASAIVLAGLLLLQPTRQPG
jgi:drug/metabolite transporter (DMT)-like permease